MNLFDLIAFIVLVFALWRGWRRGCIVQLCSLAGLILAVWLAARFGPDAGLRCGIDPEIAAPAGFLVVLLVVLLAVAIVGRIVRKIFRFAGLGLLDVLLGIAVAVVKYALLLSVLFTAFEHLNDDFRFVEQQQIEQSHTFRPLQQTAEKLFPVIERLRAEASERFGTTS